jgi:hypothetical protein
MPTETNYVYAVAIRQTDFNAQNLLNILHFRRIADVGPATVAELLALGNAIKEVQRPSQHNNITYRDYTATQVAGPGVSYGVVDCRQAGGALISTAASGTIIGGVAVDALPSKDCIVATLRTAQRGRSRRGRVYTGGLPEDAQTNGLVNAGVVTTVQTAWDAFRAIYGAGGSSTLWRWVVFSRVIASGCVADPSVRHHPLTHIRDGDQLGASAEITSVVVRSLVYSQRSRTVGHGR